jgi:hypothetical protein
MSVSNLKIRENFLFLRNSIDFYIFKFETPPGIADLTASTALDAVPHSQL